MEPDPCPTLPPTRRTPTSRVPSAARLSASPRTVKSRAVPRRATIRGGQDGCSDVSRGGLGLLLRHRFAPGTRLTVEVSGASGGSARLAGVHVVYAKPTVAAGDLCWLVGCRFDEPLSEDELKSWL